MSIDVESPFLHAGYKCGGLSIVVVSPLIIQTLPRLSSAQPLSLRGKESWLPLPAPALRHDGRNGYRIRTTCALIVVSFPRPSRSVHKELCENIPLTAGMYYSTNPGMYMILALD